MQQEIAQEKLDPAIAARVSFNSAGLVPAIAQEATTGEVLMMAWMDSAALAYTLRSRRATYYSRSRDEYWVKGLTSGHTQAVHEVRLDCDGDTVLITVDQVGGACHTGDRTCFDSDILLEDTK
ncbi:phosphoribosyl-AMP cyclohydrolase [Corynebacterium tapiri]|uniref:Phosphoribosyl-AMP cyclohydrolase n=1 Tax=Corynebacterium tapiri TaxID=1448266 RepID=A0A5C4U7I6_9CORY|nr:phosphoribosyl-AMP cyclohydrolase [Corynebacterium tapiri]